jgi:hypothetical protein
MKPSTEFNLQYDPAEITTLAEEYMKHSAQYDKEMEMLVNGSQPEITAARP